MNRTLKDRCLEWVVQQELALHVWFRYCQDNLNKESAGDTAVGGGKV